MITGNIFASLVVVAFFISYRYIFPKKKISLLYLLITLALLPTFNMFRPGTYESGDFTTHIYRSMAFFTDLTSGQLIPSWAGILNASYGYPLFIFLNPFPYYIVSLFHGIGISFVLSMKAYLFLTYILSGITMYFFAKTLWKSTFSAFTAGVFYLFAPYHLVDLNFRATVGEMTIFMFIPLIFYLMIKLRNTKKLYFVPLISLVFCLMILSHQAVSIFALVIIGSYLLYQTSQKKLQIKTQFFIILALFLGGIGATYSWLPHLILTKYTMSYILTSQLISFPSFYELLYSPWRYGFLFQGPKGELSYIIGYTQIIVVGLALFIIRTKKSRQNKIELYFWLGLFFVMIFMMTPLSSFVWKAIPLLNSAQFSTRLLIFVNLATALIAGYLAQRLSIKTPIYLLITIAIGSTMLNWGHRRVISTIEDNTLWSTLPQSTAKGEAFCCIGSPKWVDPQNPWMLNPPSTHIEILTGTGSITPLKRNTIEHGYMIKADSELSVKENTLYFPGWELLIDNTKSPIHYTNPKFPGIIFFQIPPGKHNVILQYQDVTELRYAKILSLFTFLFLIISSVYLFFTKNSR